MQISRLPKHCYYQKYFLLKLRCSTKRHWYPPASYNLTNGQEQDGNNKNHIKKNNKNPTPLYIIHSAKRVYLKYRLLPQTTSTTDGTTGRCKRGKLLARRKQLPLSPTLALVGWLNLLDVFVDCSLVSSHCRRYLCIIHSGDVAGFCNRRHLI